MSFDFIKNISESALISNRASLKHYTARDIADLIFLNFLALYILRSDFSGLVFSKAYASKTLSNSFDTFSNSSTDLHVLIHTLFGKNNDQTISHLKDPEASAILAKNLYLNIGNVKGFLSKIIQGKPADSQDRQFMLSLETQLAITSGNYKSIRRVIIEWDNLSNSEKETGLKSLLSALKDIGRKSEVIPALEKVAKDNKIDVKPSSSSNTQKYVKGLAVGGAIGGFMLAKSLKDFVGSASKPRKYNENASAGAVSAGAIAPLPTPLFSEPQRRNPKKKKDISDK